MNALVVASCLPALALYLQGCGGPAAPTTQPCKSPTLRLVSQTLKGTITGSIAGSLGLEGNSTFDAAIDWEKLNVVAHAHGINPKTGQPVDVDIILDGDKKVGTLHSTFPEKTCKVYHADKIPSVQALSALIREQLMLKMKCEGRHDDADRYEFKSPVSITTPVALSGNADVRLDLDDAGLVRSITADADGSVHDPSQPPLDEKVHGDVVITESRAGGPSEADLVVPSAWGPCTPVTPPPSLQLPEDSSIAATVVV
eukprot:TRINITY_DN72787_c0_g1_i1.p1 TRINITY_DN72787_c0_g1~~TRINITY_DN72787_c0_g1_i1.p1  ORF type:complete len:283 (+),score=68.96 TRINITY_DN72787_c0_g1_i1:83-850(+)